MAEKAKLQDAPEKLASAQEASKDVVKKEHPVKATSPETLLRIRRDDIYRRALQQPESFRLTFAPQDVMTETSRTMMFRMGEDEKIYAIPRDFIRKERGRFQAVILPDREYSVFELGKDDRKTVSEPLHLRGNDLINLYEQNRMAKAAKTAEKSRRKSHGNWCRTGCCSKELLHVHEQI